MRKNARALLMIALMLALSGSARSEEAGEAGWLGAWLGDAMDGGTQVMALVGGGPAQKAGLRAGDIIVGVGEREVANQKVLGDVLSGHRPGDSLAFLILRSGESARIEVRLGTRPYDGAGVVLPGIEPWTSRVAPLAGVQEHRLQSIRADGLAGIEVAEITPALREHYGAPQSAGVLVVAVADPGDGGADALRVGDVLVEIGGQGIRDERQLERTLITWPWDRPLEARVVRDGQSRSLVLAQVQAIEEHAIHERERNEQRVIEKRLQAEIERLQRRVRELQSQLQRLRDSD